MNREQQIIEYIEKEKETKAIDILEHLNTINSVFIGITALKITLSEMYRKGLIRKDKWGIYSPSLTNISPYVFAGTTATIKIGYDELAKIIADVFQVEIALLQSKNRHRDLVDARKAFFYFSVKLRDRYKLKDSLKSIGNMLNKDHSTVIYACSEAESLIEFDTEFRNKINKIDTIISDKNLAMSDTSTDDRTIGYYFDKPEQLKRYALL